MVLALSMALGTPMAQDKILEAEKRARQISRWYEVLVGQAMARHYDPGSFLVDARVILDDMVQKIGPQGEQPTPAASPAEPEGYEEAIDMAGFNPDGLDALPGLPVLPDEMRGKADPEVLPNGRTRKEVGIRYIDLTILVDTVYSLEDIDFITELVSMSAKLDDYRGDRVSIRKKLFPRTRRELGGHRIHSDSALHPVEAKQADAKHPWAGYWEELPALLPLLLILAFLSVVTYLVLRSLRSPNIGSELMEKLDKVAQATSAQTPVATPTPAVVDPEEELTSQMSAFRMASLNALIGDPAGGAAVLRNWIEVSREKGLHETAVMVQALDPRVLEVVRPHLHAADLRAIQLQLETQEPATTLEKAEILRFFLRDLRTLRAAKADLAISDIFGFLRQLSNVQVLHILKGEAAGIIGLALAQLPPERAGQILQQMDRDLRSQVLVGMGQIDTIPVQAYKEVAEILSRKALEVGNMRFVAADGVQTVLDLVQNLGLEEQSEYLRNIAERDITLAGRIRRFYALFEELPTLAETLRSKVLSALDRDVLVAALVGTDAEFRASLLSVVPQRMRLAVESGIDAKADQGAGETEKARKLLLAAVRKELQNMGGRE